MDVKNLIAFLALVSLVSMVVIRVRMMAAKGIKALNVGNIRKSDFLLPPVALLYLYVITAQVFGLPTFAHAVFFVSALAAWIGVGFCLVGVLGFLAALISFGKSFRVGIDPDHREGLMTTGVFALSRNPIYVSFLLVFLGEFLVFPNLVPALFVVGAFLLIHRQILFEESFLAERYPEEFADYRRRVRRYV